MFIGTVKVGGRRYVRVLESVRVNGKPSHRVVANLGNLEKLEQHLPSILRGLHRLLGEDLDEQSRELELENLTHAEWGVTFVTKQLWDELGVGRVLQSCVHSTDELSPTSILIRTMLTNRLSEPRSKLGIAEWLKDVTMGEAEDRFLRRYRNDPVSLADRFYKAMDTLLRHRGAIERTLYKRLRHLFSLKADTVFYDLTSSYFEGSEAELGRFGYSRDEKPNNLQVVIGLVLIDGLPVGHHVFRGNRRDSSCLLAALEQIERRFEIGRVILVGDRGLLTKSNIKILREKGYEYILACRKRRSKETRQALRARPDGATADYAELSRPVTWSLVAEDGDRLVGYANPKAVCYDSDRRQDILRVFRQQLRDLQTRFRKRHQPRDERIAQLAELLATRNGLGKRYFDAFIDERGELWYRSKQRVLRYERLIDGTTILQTNNHKLSDRQVVERYKELAQIEDAFRELKDFIELRPMFHWKARRIAAHVFLCVLALLFEALLSRRLDDVGLGDMTARRALDEMKRIRMLEDRVGGVKLKRISWLSETQRRLLKAFGMEPPSPLVAVKRGNGR